MNKIITFHMVAKCKSFTRAAESLGLTQPAVSLQIKSLEDECGMELFERVGKNILLTDAGKTLLLYVEKILHTMEEAKRALKEAQDPLSGEIKFGASILSGIYVIPPILGKFLKGNIHMLRSL
ncbi:LysR family transcriptional regulator [Acetomicrobium sp.]|uniref:LysR family transcriptional regulator n=1 Tax=Acetomicrobium sp. TaxID=1872099 RepID=UPI002FC86393